MLSKYGWDSTAQEIYWCNVESDHIEKQQSEVLSQNMFFKILYYSLEKICVGIFLW